MAGECVMDPASSWGSQRHAAEAWRGIDPLASPTLWASVVTPGFPLSGRLSLSKPLDIVDFHVLVGVRLEPPCAALALLLG